MRSPRWLLLLALGVLGACGPATVPTTDVPPPVCVGATACRPVFDSIVKARARRVREADSLAYLRDSLRAMRRLAERRLAGGTR